MNPELAILPIQAAPARVIGDSVRELACLFSPTCRFLLFSFPQSQSGPGRIQRCRRSFIPHVLPPYDHLQ